MTQACFKKAARAFIRLSPDSTAGVNFSNILHKAQNGAYKWRKAFISNFTNFFSQLNSQQMFTKFMPNFCNKCHLLCNIRYVFFVA